MDKVTFGKGVLPRLNEVVGEVVPEGGKVLVVEDNYAHPEVKKMLSRRFRHASVVVARPMTAASVRAVVPDEEIKAVISVGGAAACNAAKYVGTRHSLPHFTVMCAHEDSSFLLPAAVLEDDFVRRYRADPPAALVCDTALLASDDRLNASALGDIVSVLAAVFDCEIATLIFGKKMNESAQVKALGAVRAVLSKPLSPHNLAKELLTVSAAKADCPALDNGGETQVFRAVRLLSPMYRSAGEEKLTAAAVALTAYLDFLRLPTLDFVKIPMNNRRIAELIRLGHTPTLAYSRAGGYRAQPWLSRSAFVLREYAPELTAKCKTYLKTLCYAHKSFKRLYNDKGFEYNEYVRGLDLRRALRISPDTGNAATLLTYMKASGILEK